jgi:hypothetical protein
MCICMKKNYVNADQWNLNSGSALTLFANWIESAISNHL